MTSAPPAEASSAPTPPRGIKPLLKRMLPSFLLGMVRDCEGMAPAVAFTYVRLRVARWLRLRGDRRRLRRRPRSLLFVCHGNVMRSPVAAELFRKRLGTASPQFAVASAGTWTTNGRPPDPRAVGAAAELGISLQAHRSQIITAAMIERVELICVMDHRNEAELLARFPGAARKTILLGGIARRPYGGASIPDPYALEADGVAATYRQLSAAVDALVARLRPR